MPSSFPRLLHRCALAAAAFAATLQGLADSTRSRISFNDDWFFKLDDPEALSASLEYERVKPWVLPTGGGFLGVASRNPKAPAGEPAGDVPYVKSEYDHAAWRRLSLPHDWAIEGPFRQDLPGETGKLPWVGTGWYRKTFTAPALEGARRLFLQIDGAMAYSMVWCNGRFVGGWPYGYSSYQLDLTPFLKPGQSNTLAIRLQNPPESSRWYPGSGLYRNVWLLETAPLHVDHWGVHVKTPSITDAEALLDVMVDVRNSTDDPAARAVANEAWHPDEHSPEVEVQNVVYLASADGKPTGDVLASGPRVKTRVKDGFSARVNTPLRLPKPVRWTLAQPQRYVVETTVSLGGKVLDRALTPFGVRTAEFRTDGFYLNGVRTPLNGVCNHHDLGALGAGLNVRALERQLEILKEMGCNAIRTSHNPPAPELPELSDRMGILLMEEAYDCWELEKKPNGYNRLFADWHEKDIRALVRRDRNHPSIILWSIGNEVVETWFPEPHRLAYHLTSLVHQEDGSRPTTCGYNGVQAAYNGMQTGVDVTGFNYKPDLYVPFRERNPLRPVIGSETSSCISSRGEYFFPISDDKAHGRENFQVSSYDLSAPPWAFPPDVEWKGLDEAGFVGGEFVWTGFDYLGEPTPYNDDATNLLNFSDPAQRAAMEKELKDLGKIRVPSRSSYFGIIDLAGFPKDRYYLYQARWRPDHPMAHILPHWNWPERVGQITPVHVYSSGDEAELFLNGKSLGRRTRGALEYRFRWDDVVYQPGELKVFVTKAGKPWAQATTRTTGAAKKLSLKADRVRVKGDGRDLVFVTVSVLDERGDLVPRSHPKIRFRTTGAGVLAAVDNGDATSFESFQASERTAYNGLALAILRPLAGGSGKLRLEAEAEGLAGGFVEVDVAAP